VPRDKLFVRDDEYGLFQRTTFSLGTNFNTKLYGLLVRPFGLDAKFRHLVTPSVGFHWNPDFSDRQWGYFKRATLADGRTLRYDRFPASDNVTGGTPAGLSEAVNFGLGQIYQMKTGDSTRGEKEQNFELLAWDMSTAVDLKRDSLKWNDLGMSFRTGIPGTIVGPVQSLSLNVSTSHSFYEQVANGRRVNRFFWQRPGAKWYAPLDLTSASIDLGFSIRADHIGSIFQFGKEARADTAAVADSALVPGAATPPDLSERAFQEPSPPPGGPEKEEQLNKTTEQGPAELSQMPLTATVNIHETHDYVFHSELSGLATRISYSLTPKWDMSLDYNYDLRHKVINNVGVVITRDLHCWEMSLQWYPLGWHPGYFFRLAIKSPMLKDVKIERNRLSTGAFSQ